MGACLQDSKFTDVTATSVFWSKGGLVVVDGVTYSNVTTEDVQWDGSGSVAGSGNLQAPIVREFNVGQVAADSLDTLNRSPSAGVAQLTSEDPWFVAVKQVQFHLKPHVPDDCTAQLVPQTGPSWATYLQGHRN